MRFRIFIKNKFYYNVLLLINLFFNSFRYKYTKSIYTSEQFKKFDYNLNYKYSKHYIRKFKFRISSTPLNIQRYWNNCKYFYPYLFDNIYFFLNKISFKKYYLKFSLKLMLFYTKYIKINNLFKEKKKFFFSYNIKKKKIFFKFFYILYHDILFFLKNVNILLFENFFFLFTRLVIFNLYHLFFINLFFLRFIIICYLKYFLLYYKLYIFILNLFKHFLKSLLTKYWYKYFRYYYYFIKKKLVFFFVTLVYKLSVLFNLSKITRIYF